MRFFYFAVFFAAFALIVSIIIIVGIAWTHHPRGVIHHFLKRRKGDIHGKDR